MKQFFVILFSIIVLIVLLSFFPSKSLAVWSSQYFDTQCVAGTTENPCNFGYFNPDCSLASVICEISPTCDLKTGNQCFNNPYWEGGFQQCVNTNDVHRTDGSVFTTFPSCTLDGWPGPYYGFQFYTPPPTPTSFPPTPTPLPPTPTPTSIPPTPTSPPVPCQVTTNPSPVNLVVGQTGGITASVTSGLGTATILQMRFGSYNTGIATVNPIVDSIPIYQTTVTAAAIGATAVWATADLDDGRVCQSTGATDTDINVLAPTPTPTSVPPTPSPTPIPSCLTHVDCNSCVSDLSCAWGTKKTGGNVCTNFVYACDTSVYSGWYWFDCGTNECPAPTPTPYPGPITPTLTPTPKVPTPTPTPTPITGWQVCNLNVYSDPSCNTFTGTATWPCSNPNPFASGSCKSYGGDFAQKTSCSSCTPPPTPTPTPGSGIYQIQGTIYIDSNKNGVRDASEELYTGPSGNSSGDIYYFESLFGQGWVYKSPATGVYTINYLEENLGGYDEPYYIYYGGIPKDYTAINPPLSAPDFSTKPGYKVKVGSPCASWRNTMDLTYGYYDYNCYNINSGFISNLNFGIYPPPPPKWFQSIGADIRIDKPSDPLLINKIPSGKTGMLNGLGGNPGILFTGANTPDLGDGTLSSTNWRVGSFSYPDIYTESIPLIATSYTFLFETAHKANLTPLDMNSQCAGGITNCNLNTSLPYGLYIADSNLVLEDPADASYTFPSNQNYIILVNGDLTIKEKILVPNTSTVLFSAKGNIKIDRSVGESTLSSVNPNIEGVYSSDKDFIADGINNCSVATDKRLNIAGSVIANAARINATFQNNRNLCNNNLSYPSVTFIERPDFIFNFSKTYTFLPLLQRTLTSWKEIAP